MSYEIIVSGISRKTAQIISRIVKSEAQNGGLNGLDLKDKIMIQKTR